MTTPRPSWIREHLSSAERDKLRQGLLAAAGVGLIMLAACNMAQSAPLVTCDQRGCSDWSKPQAQSRRQISQTADANGNAVIVGRRPAGCPRRYCGCATSLHVFGKIKPELNLALNWARKFPRTSPASGMVAARSGHVMVLLSHVEGNEWLTYDPNSGGGLTRQHVRSIRGFKIVNPYGSYAER